MHYYDVERENIVDNYVVETEDVDDEFSWPWSMPPEEPTNTEVLDYIENNPTSYLFEPAVMIRVGPPHLKLMTQFGRSKNLNNPDLPQEDFSLSIGLFVRF